jgi:hypothetical protein
VVSRAAVGATAWSSAKKAPGHEDDDDEWEDIVAPDDSATPIEGLLSAVAAPPPPPLLPLTTTGVMAAPPPPTLLGTAVDNLTPVLTPVAPFAGTDTTTPAPGATELARDLGLSDDELALALSAHDDAAFAENTPASLDGAADADEGQGLADSIAAQLEPPSLPPELQKPDGFADQHADQHTQ